MIAAHAAISFMETPIGWAIQDRSRSLAADLFVWVIHGFAMPAFFWLSGVLARVSLARVGPRGFARQRLRRVLVPFLLALIPMSLALTALWDWGRVVAGGRPGATLSAPVLRASSLPITLGHLWYLYYLLVVSAACLAIVVVGRRVTLPRVRGPLLPALLVVPLAAILGVAGKLQLDTPLSFAIDPGILVFHGLCFAWGFRDDLTAHARWAWLYVAIALGLLVALVPSLKSTRPGILAYVASAAFTCASTAALVGLSARSAARPSAALRLVSEASYWLYLVHLPIVVLLQILLADATWPGPVKLLLVAGAPLAIGLVTYRGRAVLASRP